MVSLLISGVLTLYNYLIVLSKKTEYRATAYRLLDSKIEEYRNVNFDALDSLNGSVISPAPNLPPGSSIITSVTKNIEGTSQEDICLVTVTVNWNFKGQQTARISTYIARGGLQR